MTERIQRRVQSSDATPVHPGGRNPRGVLRITTVRVVTQSVMFALFVAFVLLTSFASLDRLPGLRRWVGLFLDIDPLIAVATALTTHTVYRGLLWSLVVIIPTLFLGRFFCGWVCPYGALHHFVGWAFGGRKPVIPSATERSEESGPIARSHSGRAGRQTYRPAQKLKYVILIAALVAAACGTLQIGLLDPLCLLYRSMTAAVIPAGQTGLERVAPQLLGPPRLHVGAWLIGFLLFALVAANLVWPRFFCRVLCPLGALLGLLSRWSWWRIARDPVSCGECGNCRKHCAGACDPDTRLRSAECLLCFNCIEDCPRGALRFAHFAQTVPVTAPAGTTSASVNPVTIIPSPQDLAPTTLAGPDIGRRKLIFAGVTGLLLYPFLRTTGRATRDFSSRVIRPPGALEELDFLERCVKCDQCVRVCPTNVVQPAALEAGVEGLWTPMLNFRIGYCQLNCTACSQVCPTGAIRRISVAEKLGQRENGSPDAAPSPIRLGTAHVDVNRCLPHSADIACQVCEEVCPTSPKAITVERHGRFRGGRGGGGASDAAGPGRGEGRGRGRRGGGSGESTEQDAGAENHAGGSEVLAPRVDINRCIGCGICEHECPVVGDQRGIYITAEGESRSAGYPPARNRTVRLG